MRTIERVIVSAVIFSRDGKIFLGKKHQDKGGVYIDCWHIPGGGIDDGEDKTEALKREILEETGIDIKNYQIHLVDDLGSGESEKTLKSGEKVFCKMKFYVYSVKLDDRNADEIKISLDDDLEQYIWVLPSELSKFKLVPASYGLFERMGLLNKN